MPVDDKKQCPIRLYPDTYEKIRQKTLDDKISFQKLGEILFNAYLQDNKEITKLIKKYADSKYARKRHEFDDMEREELLRYIEKQSPFTALEEALKELDEELENK